MPGVFYLRLFQSSVDVFPFCFQLPQSSSYFGNVYDSHFDKSGGSDDSQTSLSCPADPSGTRPYRGGRRREEEPPGFLSEEQAQQWAKERQKKDNHNQSKPSILLFKTIVL
jgi:hypothetical protein